MTVVSVSELKARLSHYLREVRRGGEVQVVDRGRPVARLVAVGDAYRQADDDSRQRLLASGLVRAGDGRILECLDQPPLDLPVGISAALHEDRTDRL